MDALGDVEGLRHEVLEFLGRFFRFRGDRGEDHGAGDRLGGEKLAGRDRGRLGRRQAAAAEERRQPGASGRAAQAGCIGRGFGRAALLLAGLRDPPLGGFEGRADRRQRASRRRPAGRTSTPTKRPRAWAGSAPESAPRRGRASFRQAGPRSRPDANPAAPAPWPARPARPPSKWSSSVKSPVERRSCPY